MLPCQRIFSFNFILNNLIDSNSSNSNSFGDGDADGVVMILCVIFTDMVKDSIPMF